jgi:hypothetical protein
MSIQYEDHIHDFQQVFVTYLALTVIIKHG